jgi:hypothetical protein
VFLNTIIPDIQKGKITPCEKKEFASKHNMIKFVKPMIEKTP